MAVRQIERLMAFLHEAHARHLRRAASASTREEMARLPRHLLDDVNALGLTGERRFAANQNEPASTVISFNKSYASHKIYSLD